EGYYQKNGEPTKQLERVRLALKPVRELYGHTAVKDFGPRALKAVRERMVTMSCGHCKGTGKLPKKRRTKKHAPLPERPCTWCAGQGTKGWTRGHINSAVGCIKRMIKWAVAEELVPATVYHGLQAVSGLKKGRTPARETQPVRPAPDQHVEVVLPLLLAPVQAMVEVQRLAGMRPGEVVLMRGCDIDRSHGH